MNIVPPKRCFIHNKRLASYRGIGGWIQRARCLILKRVDAECTDWISLCGKEELGPQVMEVVQQTLGLNAEEWENVSWFYPHTHLDPSLAASNWKETLDTLRIPQDLRVTLTKLIENVSNNSAH